MSRLWLRPRSIPHIRTRRVRPLSKTWTRSASRIRAQIPPTFPVIESCPSPTCVCKPMPFGLDIDVTHNLNGSMAPYAEQVFICTGKNDWTSKIEEDEVSVMARGLKDLLGRGGKYSDVRGSALSRCSRRSCEICIARQGNCLTRYIAIPQCNDHEFFIRICTSHIIWERLSVSAAQLPVPA